MRLNCVGKLPLFACVTGMLEELELESRKYIYSAKTPSFFYSGRWTPIAREKSDIVACAFLYLERCCFSEFEELLEGGSETTYLLHSLVVMSCLPTAVSAFCRW